MNSINARRIDIGIFGMLIAALMLYQLQHIFPKFASFHVREVLYLYLYFRVLLFYKIRLSPLLMMVLVFLLYALLIGIHTWYVAGPVVAFAGFKRFVHLALMAPLAAVLLENDSDAKPMFYLWMGIVLVGVMTVVYQLVGGQMDWLVRGYIAIRGDLVRHKSLLGEPNVGGMAAGIAFFVSSTAVRSPLVRLPLVLLFSFLVVVSLSKAAWIGCLLMGIAIIIVDMMNANRAGGRFPSNQLWLQFSALGVWFLLLACHPLIYRYMDVGFSSLVGSQADAPGAMQDFANRVLFPGLFPGSYGSGISAGTGNSVTDELLKLFFGQSFARAGSAATDLKAPMAIIPHNMYLELYLVGGLLFLFSLFWIQWHTLKMLATYRIGVGRFLIPPFILISLYMMGYPNLYEPITGTFFWLAVGLACRSQKVHRE